jgi:antitoxin PrlF
MTQKMGAKGQVVIPKDLRDQIGIGPGDDVAFEPLADGIVVRRATEHAPLRGRFAKSGMAARLLEDRRKEPR